MRTLPSAIGPRDTGAVGAGDDGGTVSRRAVLLGTAGLGGVAVLGAAAYAIGPDRIRGRLGLLPDPWIPDAPQGQVRLETVRSDARGRDVQLFTAVPYGHGDGAGLPVVVVLHGASATAADFEAFGLARFLTRSAQDGAAPFVLVGADGGAQRWVARGTDDPGAMVTDELPGWAATRGFDADRLALWGWSMGGYGALRIAETTPGFARAVAAFSPAIATGDAVFAGAAAVAHTPLGVWCGEDDSFFPAVSEFVDALPTPPEVASFGAGGHTRNYWNDHTLAAFDFLASHLSS